MIRIDTNYLDFKDNFAYSVLRSVCSNGKAQVSISREGCSLWYCIFYVGNSPAILNIDIPTAKK
jgi:hypothetical protein